MEQRHKLLGTLLVEMDVIDEKKLEQGLTLHRQSDKKIGEALQELGFCTSEDVCQALAQQSGLRYLDPNTIEIPRDVVKMVPESLVREHHVVPISREDGHLTIATSDPFDLFAQDNVRFATGAEIDCVLASRESIQRAIEKNYGISQHKLDQALADANQQVEFKEEKELEESLETEGDDAPVIKLVTLVISEALKRRASDIHIEPMEDRLRIRYRVDGVCFEVDSPPKRLQASIISRIKIMAKIDIAEKRRPTDGRIKLRLVGKEVDLRVSCLPASHGESVVLRILDKSSVLYGIQELGFMDDDYKRFRGIIRRPNGVFLVTGPTGSGKTTTLYAALQELNTPDRKIITAENPVEYNISGLNQAEVRSNIGLTFARILRAMLRQAPEIILVGEIRDAETAEIAIQAALTGHLVFSTLHTNDAPSAITRLIDMGVAPFLVSSAIQAIMAQRLVRTICPHCKRPRDYKPHELAWVGLREEEVQGVTFYEGAGCRECSGTGYKGRLGIFEMLEMTSEMRELAFRKASTNKLRDEAIVSGMRTLRDDGVRKVISGLTTIEELLRITAEVQAMYE
ncbi:MAG TPA: type II secretion system ATPase GspE [Planctomycetota bacterium]|nr:type II secretion system ATPase GspE [Planctomycetota bacterium]